jgi:hypothetical protein
VHRWQPFAGVVYFHLLLANLAEHGTLPESSSTPPARSVFETGQ